MLSELEVRAQLLEIKGKNTEAKQGTTKIGLINPQIDHFFSSRSKKYATAANEDVKTRLLKHMPRILAFLFLPHLS